MTPLTDSPPSAGADWTVIIPFYNEEGYLEATLASFAAQTLEAAYILVDNASTDTSPGIAKAFEANNPGLSVTLIREETPGKAAALATGIASAATPYIATADADTYYPPEYLARADRLFREAGPEAVAALAFGAPPESEPGHAGVLQKGSIVSKLMPRQCHTGGYGQCFNTAALKEVGSFSRERWPYCLMDHEIIHRLTKLHHGRGKLLYAADHWCAPSPRRADRGRVRWTLPERLLYHIVPFHRRDWFFYEFLANRFKARGVSELNLRRKEWQEERSA